MLTVAYFVQELQDAAVSRRVRMFEAGGGACTLLGFDRIRESRPRPTPESAIVLGQTQNGRLFERIFSVLMAAPRAWKQRAAWRNADLIVARNLEMLALARILLALSGADTRLVYECLDIHRMMLGDRPINKIMRSVERFLLKRVSVLITSSPAFVTHYFKARQNYQGEVAILENKIMAIDTPTPSPQQTPSPTGPSSGPPWRIVWCGVLRCARSLELLCDLASTKPDKVEIELWGMPAYDQISDFDERIKAAGDAISFKGRYSEPDLAQIYGAAHFVWAVDYYEAGGNSDWLLPNRLYEGLAFGAVPIAVSGVATADWLEAKQAGFILDAPLSQSLPAFIETLAAPAYEAAAKRVRELDYAVTRFTRTDCETALRLLAGLETQKAAA